jgi:hypothetical protein
VALVGCAVGAGVAATPVRAQTLDTAPEVAGAEDPAPESEPNPGAASRTSGWEAGDDADADPSAVPAAAVSANPVPRRRIHYVLERVVVRTDGRTRPAVVRQFVPLRPGDLLDVDDPRIEALRWRLLGTGWFREVNLSLERGSARGRVRLVVDLVERNTLVVERVTLGVSEGILRTGDMTADAVWYGGLQVAETNFLGAGITLGAAGVLSDPQQAVRLRAAVPWLLGSGYGLDGSVFVSNARDFFGSENVVVAGSRCLEPLPEDCPDDLDARNAVVLYRRYGISVGTGHDLGGYARFTLDWQGELVDAFRVPEAAAESRNGTVRAIDFGIRRGISRISSLQLGIVYDRRDDPALPSRGLLVRFRGDAGLAVLASDYDFVRLQVSVLHWVRLPWAHALRFGSFLGMVFGDAPFFYRFYASDLSDLIPSRALDLNLDRRPPPDLLGTAVRFMRMEDFGARVDVEYDWPLWRGDAGGFYAVQAYLNLGLYALLSWRDFRLAVPGFAPLSRIPVDATFDLGVRADTDFGVFSLGFSTVLGFVRP